MQPTKYLLPIPPGMASLITGFQNSCPKASLYYAAGNHISQKNKLKEYARKLQSKNLNFFWLRSVRAVSIIALFGLLFTSCNLFKQTTEETNGKEDDEDPFEPWEETLKDAEETEGFLDLHQKEDGTLYAELSPEKLNKDFGMVMHISKGVGVFNLHRGLPLGDTRIMRFRQEGHKVFLVHRNPRFRADKGGMRISMKDNTGHSIVKAFDIVSRNDSTHHLLIKLSEFLISDYAGIGESLKPYFEKKPASFQESKSYVDTLMGFEKNVEVDAMLNYKGQKEPVMGKGAIPDYRSIPVGVRYSFFALPENPMQPRLADDRVGYFINSIKDFSKDKQIDPYLRFVQRWQLTPSDTATYKEGKLVEPEEPIIYYIDRTVPEEYQPYVKEGIEAWNEAFNEAGYKNAVVARVAPDDSAWSPEDIRYSTVQWTAAHQMSYAIGPSQTDPRTGEVLNADILISSAWVRHWKQLYENLLPEGDAHQDKPFGKPFFFGNSHRLRQMFEPEIFRHACQVERHMAQQIGLQRAVLLARDTLDPGTQMPEKYLRNAIVNLVMHEVGHTLGLRHNFKASSAIPANRLHDTTYTSKHGVSSSVMDYVPVNIALGEENQGHYWNQNVGTYDRWAIKYGYMPITKQSDKGPLTQEGSLADTTTAEQSGLDKILARSSDPMHRYATDEDSRLGPYTVDPLANLNDLGADPMAFARTRKTLIDRIDPKLEESLIAPGEDYYRLRQATTALLMEQYRSSALLTKMVGGMYMARDHKGTPGARLPFRPIAPEKQKAAAELLMNNVFAPDAFQFDAERLQKLAPNRQTSFSFGPSPTFPIAYPVHAYVEGIQSGVLDRLLHPARMRRMIDNQVRVAGREAYSPSDLLQHLTGAIWSELNSPSEEELSINSFRRNLQRNYTDRLILLMLDKKMWITLTFIGSEGLTTPEDVRSLARYELSELSTRIGSLVNQQEPDRETRAHLSETKVRIDRALEASVEVEP